MAYKMKGFSGFKSSPAKQTQQEAAERYERQVAKRRKKHLEKNKKATEKATKKHDAAMEEKQSYSGDFGDITREEIDAKFHGHYKGPKGEKVAKTKMESPAKQEGPIDKENIKLQKTEHKDTWVYKGKNKQERVIDLEDRIGFIDEDIFNQDKATPQQKKDKTKLKQELAILRKSKHK